MIFVLFFYKKRYIKMEVIQMKKGGKVKRRRAKPKQPTQTQRQVVNINMGGGGGARIGSTHTFSQPPEFYHAIREIPNQPVNYGNNPYRVSVGVGTSVGEATVPEGRPPVPDPLAPLSMKSNPSPFEPRLMPRTPPRGRGQGQPKLSLTLPRRPSPSSPPSPSAIASAEPHDYFRAAMPEVGAVAAQASSSASAAALGTQLPRVVSPRGRPRKEAGEPTAPYRRTAPYPTGAAWYDVRGLPTPESKKQSVFDQP
jgi:hypothetical protein